MVLKEITSGLNRTKVKLKSTGQAALVYHWARLGADSIPHILICFGGIIQSEISRHQREGGWVLIKLFSFSNQISDLIQVPSRVVRNMHKLWACQPTPATTKALLIGSIDRSSKQGSLRIHVSNLKQVAQTVWLSTVVWISILLCHQAEVGTTAGWHKKGIDNSKTV